jgi:hypothetical protein
MRKVDDALRSELLKQVTALAAPLADPQKAIIDALTPDANGAVTALSTRGESLTRVGDYLVETKYLGVVYQIDVTKKLPAPVQNLSDALGLLQTAAAAPLTISTRPGAVWNGKIFDILHVPSDVTVTGKLVIGPDVAQQTVSLGNNTYDNEGLYYWDVSLGIPIRTIKEVNYKDASQFVFAKDVDRQKLLLLFDVFVRPVDTKSLQTRLLPFPVVGMSLSKRPLNTLMAGLSIGLNRVSILGGARWDRLEPAAVQTDTATRDESDVHYKRSWQLVLNIPVRQVADYFKNKK